MTMTSASSILSSSSQSNSSSNSQSPNTTTSSGGITEAVSSKKPFNIQLSEDDKDIYNLNEDDDEGEDDDYEIDEEISTDKKSKEPQTNQSKSKDQPIENMEELTSSRSNSIPIYIEQSQEKKSMHSLKESQYCHRIRRIGTVFDLKEVNYFNIIKEEEKSRILSTIGFDTSFERINYLLFFEEKFIYFSRNNQINKSNTNLRCLKNYIDVFDILNIEIEDDGDEESSVRIELINKSDSIEYNEIYFLISLSRVSNLVSMLNDTFQRLNIQTTSNNYASSLSKKDNNDEEI